MISDGCWDMAGSICRDAQHQVLRGARLSCARDVAEAEGVHWRLPRSGRSHQLAYPPGPSEELVPGHGSWHLGLMDDREP